MTFLGPIFAVEWRLNARRPRFVWLRALYGAILLVALGNVLASEWADSTGALPAPRLAAVAAQFFWAFSLVQLLAVLLLTPALTAGSIAEEKERRTLEALLTTDLSAAEI